MPISLARPAAPLDRPSTGVSEDRFLLWPVVIATAIVACLILLCGLPGLLSFLLILLSFFALPVAIIILFVVTVVSAAKRRFKKAISIALAALVPFILWAPLTLAADYVHLGLTAGFGAGQIGSKAKPDGRQFEVFDWSTGLAGGPNTFLIRDATDEIALPLPLHKQAAASENGFGEDCAGHVKHLLGHYFICNF